VQDESGSGEMCKMKVAVGNCARLKWHWENVQDKSGSGEMRGRGNVRNKSGSGDGDMCKIKVAVGKCARTMKVAVGKCAR
jgi:hypothetical protein